MTAKLTGDAYKKYWRERMAKGPHEASFGGAPQDTDPQAVAFFEGILRAIPGDLECGKILEVGSGYGRMLKKLRGKFPTAALVGVELSERAARDSWRDSNTQVICAERVLFGAGPFDLAVTCTALQHMTDEATFKEVCAGIERELVSGGWLVCLENVRSTTASHMRGCPPEDYMRAFKKIMWFGSFETIIWREECHAVLVGRKGL